EQDYGWNGILVEPNRSFHASITSERSSSLDPRAATDGQTKEVRFEEDAHDGMYSRVASSNVEAEENTGTVDYVVPAASLEQILNDHNAPAWIDYLSIDTEGTELDVLAGVDWSAREFGFLTIEHNFAPGKEAALDTVLALKGYRRVLRALSEMDSWYVHSRLGERFGP
ncbi:MAG: FkbM family methyltransferase, partial [Myxococcota bacterium]